MALDWSISHADRLVVVHLTVDFHLEDIPVAYAAVIAEGGLPYRKLVDLTLVRLDVGLFDVSRISAGIRAATGTLPRGPVAFVVDCDATNELVEAFDRRTVLDRPLGIFRDRESAMRWLDEIAPPSGHGPIEPTA